MDIYDENKLFDGSEFRYCKKCGVRLPPDREDNLCVFCRNDRKNFLKKVVAAISGVLAVATTIVIALLLNDKNDKKKK